MSRIRNTGYIGTYPCAICAKHVRVYEWLPEAVLCAGCEQKRQREEKAMATKEPVDLDWCCTCGYVNPRSEKFCQMCRFKRLS